MNPAACRIFDPYKISESDIFLSSLPFKADMKAHPAVTHRMKPWYENIQIRPG
jgi:hypothetical protein